MDKKALSLLGDVILRRAQQECEKAIRRELSEDGKADGSIKVVWHKGKNGAFKKYFRMAPRQDSKKVDVYYNKMKQFKKIVYEDKVKVYLPEINFKKESRTAYAKKAVDLALKEWDNFTGYKTTRKV